MVLTCFEFYQDDVKKKNEKIEAYALQSCISLEEISPEMRCTLCADLGA